jgi:phosphohistidine phosphatase
MRTLFIIRHAKSSWDHPGLRDFDRPLNGRGLHDAPKMAAFLRAKGIQPDLLLSSPAKRALTTALFFAKEYDLPETEIARREDIYEASVQDLLLLISSLPDAANTVFLFGHNPTLTDLANQFTEDYISNIPTCGIVRVDTTALSWDKMYEGNSRVVAKYFPKETL